MSNENDIHHGRHCVFLIRKKLWGGALWSQSYFASSYGGAPIEIIRQYIEQQQTPH